jgi:hypothetical protein
VLGASKLAGLANNQPPTIHSLREATSALCAILAQRRAGFETNSAATTQAVDANARGRHIPMDRALERYQRQEIGRLDAERAARPAPCLYPGDELAE